MIDLAARYREFIDGGLLAVYDSSVDGRLLSCNAAFARMIGFPSAEEALGSDLTPLYRKPKHREWFIERIRAEGRVQNVRGQLRTRGGSIVHVLLTGVGDFDDKGHLVGIHGHLIDITEGIKAQHDLAERERHFAERIAQSEKIETVGRLAGGIAHDFNNLLTAIIGNLELASARAGEAPGAVPRLKAALHSAERGVGLIQRLLAFARKQSLDPRSLDVGGLLSSIEELLRRTLGPDIRLVISADPDLAPAHVDANQLELAILNLTINARDAMPQGGTVRITLTNRRAGRRSPPELAPGDYLVLSVSDDGTGMDVDTLAKAFEPFFTTKAMGSGSGLGLPMVQGFVGQSGGTVRIRSKLGEGTAVELWLPKADEPPFVKDIEQPARQLVRADTSVLLCDDDNDVRSLLSEFLKSSGYTVHDANGAEAAMRILESRAAIDLLIADYAMPGMNGLETIRQARLRRPDLRCLLITGYAGIPSSIEAPILRKPFTPDELAARVAELLAG
jgi:PAS domain S-box-containing protein